MHVRMLVPVGVREREWWVRWWNYGVRVQGAHGQMQVPLLWSTNTYYGRPRSSHQVATPAVAAAAAGGRRPATGASNGWATSSHHARLLQLALQQSQPLAWDNHTRKEHQERCEDTYMERQSNNWSDTRDFCLNLFFFLISGWG